MEAAGWPEATIREVIAEERKLGITKTILQHIKFTQ